jgi:hypothetical protein
VFQRTLLLSQTSNRAHVQRTPGAQLPLDHRTRYRRLHSFWRGAATTWSVHCMYPTGPVRVVRSSELPEGQRVLKVHHLAGSLSHVLCAGVYLVPAK